MQKLCNNCNAINSMPKVVIFFEFIDPSNIQVFTWTTSHPRQVDCLQFNPLTTIVGSGFIAHLKLFLL